MKIEKNSEILFLYDAKRCNPNGDMDNENKPRMDWDAGRNLVSDVRLKRYIRDYLAKKGNEIFVTEKAETAKDRVKQILGRIPSKQKPVTTEDVNKIAKVCKDVVYFGAVLGTEGGNDHLVGPVQFNWGYSLNPIYELQESKTITSSFSSGEGIGKDYRVNYSFLAFNGSINAKIAETTKFSEDDMKIFDEAMIKSIPLNRTRSKIGQTPRLYLRIELKNDELSLNDLREYIKLSYKIDKEENLRDIKEFSLNIEKLVDYVSEDSEKIDKLTYWKDKNLEISNFDEFLSLFNKKDKLKNC